MRIGQLVNVPKEALLQDAIVVPTESLTTKEFCNDESHDLPDTIPGQFRAGAG